MSTLFLLGSIDNLINYTKNEGRPTILSDEEHEAIKPKLNDNKHSLGVYVQLLIWVQNTLKKERK